MSLLGGNIMLKEDFEVIALLMCKNLGDEIDRTAIEQKVKELGVPYGFDDDVIYEVVRKVESRLVTTMDEGVSLVDPEADHDEEWINQKEGLEWSYWNEYREQLLLEGWGDKVLYSLGEVTDRILGLLKDPDTLGEWDRRGLVVGHVQSGKTANYIGLISKAADAGYRFIIVIAGIHNNLRKQTQIRIDEGFVGLSADGDKTERVGVGNRNRSRRDPVPLTNTASDFNKKTAGVHQNDLELYEQAGRPAIMVIKKNVSTLKRLYKWLTDLNADQNGQISKIPMLLIDDEADNASINTNKADLNPTQTNAWIRQLLKVFNKSCYVGYTATPFANIFINPKDEDEMVGDDLFPSDFIYCLDAPSNYFGADKVFLDNGIRKSVLRTIDDAEECFPLSHKRHDPVPDIPPTAKKAIQTFLIAKTIRNIRKQDNKHCTMMVNVSRFVDIQREVRGHIAHYLSGIQDAILANYKKPVHEALRSPIMAGLKEVFDSEYAECPESWELVQGSLYQAADGVKTYLVNSKSDESLDYGKYEADGDALTALAVGGLSLSRGLTLEGLTVSYMYRNTKMYDTLFQMGRWFGYRPGYEDLCRVYLSEESQGWYSHIAEVSEDLRQQVKQMRRDGFKPVEFGLYVRSHPDALIVTALNKMRHAKKVTLKVSFDGVLRETHMLSKSEDTRIKNLMVMTLLYETLNNEQKAKRTSEDRGTVWREVPAGYAIDFIDSFIFHKALQYREIDYKEAFTSYAREVIDTYPYWDIVFVSLVGEEHAHPVLPMALQKRQVGKENNRIKKTESEDGWHVGGRQRVSGKNVESIGLTDIEKKIAQDIAVKNKDKELTDRHFRYEAVRGRPLLMLHLLNLVDEDDGANEILGKMMPAIGISFPFTGRYRSIECVANPVWLEGMLADSPLEEDDYEIN